MTDYNPTDDLALETSGTDIRVFGKWSGAEVQISDMSLEVKIIEVEKRFLSIAILGLHSRSKTAEISSTFSWSLPSETFSKGFMSNC